MHFFYQFFYIQQNMYNVNDIKKFIHEREKGRLKIYEEVLAKCFHRIQSSVVRDDPFALFVVPDFIIGRPRYDFGNCIQYIIFRLKNNGFLVKYIYPNALKIEWGKTDFNSMLTIENDRGTLNTLAIENNPTSAPPLFDMKTPHKGENLGLFNNKQKGKKSLDINSGQYIGSKSDFTFKFKNTEKEDKKKKLQQEKFKAINSFVPLNFKPMSQ